MRLISAVSFILLLLAPAYAFWHGAASMPFTPLHTYYLASNGNDSNNGTSAGTPWATPNHAVVCGDVIIAAAGTYTTQFNQSFGVVSNCPSTSGGIDGTGGIYFAILLCGGPDVVSCQVNAGSAAVWVTQGGAQAGNPSSNWAIEGLSATQNTNAPNTGCFIAAINGNPGGTGAYIAFINDIASTCSLCGFCTSGDGNYPTNGYDQTAVIGSIAFNAAVSNGGGGNCGSGISFIGANNNSAAGTHQIAAGNFLYGNINANGTCPGGAGNNSDGEGIIWDSIGIANYSGQVVAEQNLMWYNGSSCLLGFPSVGTATDVAPYFWFNNTCYGNMNDPHHQAGADINFNQIYPTGTGRWNVYANIIENIYSKVGGSGANSVVAVADVSAKSNVTLSQPTVSIPGSNAANYLYSTAGVQTELVCNDPTPSCGSTSWVFGTNTLTDPGLANPAALPTTMINCAGHVNVFQCANAAGIPAMVANSTGIGYPTPKNCQPDAFWPAYLKGVVYLRVVGSQIIEDTGLVTKPCGM